MGPQKHKHFQQLAFAFLAGGVLTYLCTSLMGKAGAHLGFISSQATFLTRPAHPPQCPKVDPPRLPPGVGLSPLALGNLTGDASATTDRLIVAVRHSEDPHHLEAYWSGKVHRFYRRDLHTLDIREGMMEDTSWLDIYLSEIPHVVYQVDDWDKTEGAEHRTLVNKGNEAMAYLQFIIDYWGRLPASIAFIHGHRGTWHVEDHVPVLRRLRWGEVPYANLRYRNGPHNRLRWKCGNETDDPAFKKFDCNWVGNWIYPGSLKPRKEKLITTMNKDEWIDSVELTEVWDQTFEQELGPMPHTIHGPCCAEFIVSRERIEAHPREFYVGLRDWIVDTELDRYRSGRVFEYMWAIMFGEPAVTEPIEECDLLHCSEEDKAAAAVPTAAAVRHYITTTNTKDEVLRRAAE
ncbi:g3474 [Coccomyxa elongata]